MKKTGRHHSGQGINGNKTKCNHAPPHGTKSGEHDIISAIVTAKGTQPEPNQEEKVKVTLQSTKSTYKVCSFQSIKAIDVKRQKETKYI